METTDEERRLADWMDGTEVALYALLPVLIERLTASAPDPDAETAKLRRDATTALTGLTEQPQRGAIRDAARAILDNIFTQVCRRGPDDRDVIDGDISPGRSLDRS